MTMFLEAVFLAIMTGTLTYERNLHDYAQKKQLAGFRKQGHMPPETFLTITAVLWVDLVFYMVVRQQKFRLAPYGRVLLLFSFTRIQNVFVSAEKCFRQIFM